MYSPLGIRDPLVRKPQKRSGVWQSPIVFSPGCLAGVCCERFEYPIQIPTIYYDIYIYMYIDIYIYPWIRVQTKNDTKESFWVKVLAKRSCKKVFFSRVYANLQWNILSFPYLYQYSTFCNKMWGKMHQPPWSLALLFMFLPEKTLFYSCWQDITFTESRWKNSLAHHWDHTLKYRHEYCGLAPFSSLLRCQ